jgi:hypothetical protein
MLGGTGRSGEGGSRTGPTGLLHVRGGKGMAARSIELEKKGIRALKRWLSVRPSTPYDHIFLNRDEGAPEMMRVEPHRRVCGQHGQPHHAPRWSARGGIGLCLV